MTTPPHPPIKWVGLRCFSPFFAIALTLAIVNVLYFGAIWMYPVVSISASPAEMDVGDVTQKPFAKSFQIQNSGNRVVWLQEPVPTCSCTQMELPNRKLWPRQKVGLIAHFRSGPTDGPISTLVYVPYSSSGQQGELQLRMVGRVTAHVGIEPASGALDLASGNALEFNCQARCSPSIKIKPPYCTHLNVDVTFKQISDKSVSISVTPTPTKSEKTSEIDRPAQLVVVTNSEWTPIIRIPLRVSL